MPFGIKSLAGPGYIVLNVIRGLNVIGLLAMVAASVALLIKTTTDSSVGALLALDHTLLTTLVLLL